MPYIMNAVAIGANDATPIIVGSLVGEPDDPPTVNLDTAIGRFSGVRLLIVTDDGSGYRSSREMVQIPTGFSPAVLTLPPHLHPAFKKLLEYILRRSPTLSVVLYLEANRIISYPEEEMPGSAPQLHSIGTINDFLDLVQDGGVVEAVLYLVQE